MDRNESEIIPASVLEAANELGSRIQASLAALLEAAVKNAPEGVNKVEIFTNQGAKLGEANVCGTDDSKKSTPARL